MLLLKWIFLKLFNDKNEIIANKTVHLKAIALRVVQVYKTLSIEDILSHFPATELPKQNIMLEIVLLRKITVTHFPNFRFCLCCHSSWWQISRNISICFIYYHNFRLLVIKLGESEKQPVFVRAEFGFEEISIYQGKGFLLYFWRKYVV